MTQTQREYQEQQRLKRLNAESFWDAVDTTFAEYQAQKPASHPTKQERPESIRQRTN